MHIGVTYNYHYTLKDYMVLHGHCQEQQYYVQCQETFSKTIGFCFYTVF
jgi:hypothetical protein